MRALLNIALLLILFLNCEKVVEVDIPAHDPVLVGSAFFTPDSFWAVRITRSTDILSPNNMALQIENATVELWQEEQYLTDLAHQGNGRYRSETLRPVAGKNYTLRAAAPNFAAIEASDYLSPPVAITSVLNLPARSGDPDEYVRLRLAFDDPPDVDNYYLLSIQMVDVFGYRFFNHFETSNPVIMANSDEDNGPVNIDDFFDNEAVFDDVLFAGETLEIDFGYYDFLFGSNSLAQVYIRLSSVSENYFRHHKTFRKAETVDGGNPFQEPVLIYSNIQNGIGIFAGYSTSVWPLFN